MKKRYIAPTIRCINIQTEMLLNVASPVFNGSVKIEKDNPAKEYDVTAKKHRNSLWDDFDDED